MEALGPRLTVRGEQLRRGADGGEPFWPHRAARGVVPAAGRCRRRPARVVYKHGTLEIHARRTKLEPHSVPIEPASYGFNPNAEPC